MSGVIPLNFGYILKATNIKSLPTIFGPLIIFLTAIWLPHGQLWAIIDISHCVFTYLT